MTLHVTQWFRSLLVIALGLMLLQPMLASADQATYIYDDLGRLSRRITMTRSAICSRSRAVQMRLLDYEKCAFWVGDKLGEVSLVESQELLNGRGRTIAAAHPDNLGRMAEQETPLMKVGVLGDESEAMLGGVVPDGLVGGFAKTDVSHGVSRWGQA